MKKSMITMCIAAMVAISFPVAAAEPNHAPPVKQEIRVVNKADGATNEETVVAKEVAPVTDENGNENTTSSSRGGGYVVISGAGLLLIIILLILLL